LDEDWFTLSEWWACHRYAGPDRSMLPKLGIMVEKDGPIAAIWLYMDNSVGVCFAEYPVTKPGLSMKEARESFTHAIEFLKIAAKEMNYGILIVRTRPAIARILFKLGFTKDQENIVGMWTLTGVQNGS
jgi:hypothetical protein